MTRSYYLFNKSNVVISGCHCVMTKRSTLSLRSAPRALWQSRFYLSPAFKKLSRVDGITRNNFVPLRFQRITRRRGGGSPRRI